MLGLAVHSTLAGGLQRHRALFAVVLLLLVACILACLPAGQAHAADVKVYVGYAGGPYFLKGTVEDSWLKNYPLDDEVEYERLNGVLTQMRATGAPLDDALARAGVSPSLLRNAQYLVFRSSGIGIYDHSPVDGGIGYADLFRTRYHCEDLDEYLDPAAAGSLSLEDWRDMTKRRVVPLLSSVAYYTEYSQVTIPAAPGSSAGASGAGSGAAPSAASGEVPDGGQDWAEGQDRADLADGSGPDTGEAPDAGGSSGDDEVRDDSLPGDGAEVPDAAEGAPADGDGGDGPAVGEVTAEAVDASGSDAVPEGVEPASEVEGPGEDAAEGDAYSDAPEETPEPSPDATTVQAEDPEAPVSTAEDDDDDGDGGSDDPAPSYEWTPGAERKYSGHRLFYGLAGYDDANIYCGIAANAITITYAGTPRLSFAESNANAQAGDGYVWLTPQISAVDPTIAENAFSKARWKSSNTGIASTPRWDPDRKQIYFKAKKAGSFSITATFGDSADPAFVATASVAGTVSAQADSNPERGSGNGEGDGQGDGKGSGDGGGTNAGEGGGGSHDGDDQGDRAGANPGADPSEHQGGANPDASEAANPRTAGGPSADRPRTRTRAAAGAQADERRAQATAASSRADIPDDRGTGDSGGGSGTAAPVLRPDADRNPVYKIGQAVDELAAQPLSPLVWLLVLGLVALGAAMRAGMFARDLHEPRPRGKHARKATVG